MSKKVDAKVSERMWMVFFWGDPNPHFFSDEKRLRVACQLAIKAGIICDITVLW